MFKDKLQSFGLDKRLKAIYTKYERLLIPGFLVVGFIFDVITFKALDIRTALQLLFGYVVMAGLVLVYIHIYDARSEPSRWRIWSYLRFLAPLALQLSFGALLSSSLLFYWFSGSLSVSWPLFVVITGIMISSELFRKFYMRPAVQLSLYNFVILSYLAVLFPFILKSLSGWIFILSGAISTLVVMGLVLGLSYFSATIKRQQPSLILASFAVLVVMNAGYFLNLIPPLPLSIREAGMYYDIVRQPGSYELVGPEESWWQALVPGQNIQLDTGDSLYAYTAIFAPAEVLTTIYHTWEYRDPLTDRWIEKSRLSFTARGGRGDGFRGYTLKFALAPGKWRVTVQNVRGQVLGRLPFTIELL